MRPASLAAAALAGVLLLTAGCSTRGKYYKLGRKAQELQDYDTALVYYKRALRADPTNAQYKLSVAQMRFQAAQAHVELGQTLMAKGDLTDVETALGNFQRALDIDPASAIAEQMMRKAIERIAELKKSARPKPHPTQQYLEELRSTPPRLKPISTQPINLKMTNDARIVYETIAKLAGLTVLFDPDFSSRRISIELPNVTLQQALDAVALESKSFWQPVTSGIIFVAPDNPQTRRQYQNQIVKTFYLKNTLTPQDLTAILGGLRQLLQLQRVQQINSLNAIVIRSTPDKVAAAEKIINDIDKERAEVMLQVSVLEVNQNRLRDLGIQPGSSAVATFTPRSALQPEQSSSSSSSSTTSTTTSQITLNNLRRLSTADYSITLPGATVKALLTDNTTKIIQNPEVRITDGDTAHLRIGDRVPIATGSFQAGVGVGVGTAGTSLVNPLVNTQFQYQDVGVNIDVTPRVHPDEDVSLKLDIEVSAVTGYQNIGGIQQPIISQRKIQNQIRLKDGQVSVLGGLVQHTTTKSVAGWPGFDKIPFLKYFFTDQSIQKQNDEVLIVITPHVVRMPDITAENMRSLFTGTQQNVEVLSRTAPAGADGSAGAPIFPPVSGKAAPSTPAAESQAKATGTLSFEPATLTLKPGQTATVALAVHNAADLYSIPMILHYNPKVIAVEDVRDGGFLSGGTQVVSIFHHEDAKKGESIISAMRQPNSPGVNGSGTLVGVVVKALAPGTSPLAIQEVSAKSSQGKPLAFKTRAATIHVGTP